MNTDEELHVIKRAQNGDEAAFEQLLNTRYKDMYKIAYKWCGNAENAEDITQDACIKLARGLSSFKHKSKFSSWLYALVINAAKDWADKNNKHRGSSEALNTVQTPETAQNKTYTSQVWAEIHKLPVGEKEAVILVLSEGYTHAEAAKILKTKEKTISWRIHEARKKLSAIFEQEYNHG